MVSPLGKKDARFLCAQVGQYLKISTIDWDICHARDCSLSPRLWRRLTLLLFVNRLR